VSPYRTPPSSTARNIRPATIVGLVGLVLAALLGLTTGLSGVLLGVGLYLFFTALWALVRKRSWLGRTSRAGAAALLAGSLVVVGIGGATGSPPR
jgi:hypothetical protein